MAFDPVPTISPGHAGDLPEIECSAVRKPTIAEEFQQHAAAWRKATAHVSSSSEKVAHPSFQAIIGMGAAVVPLLLHELAHRTGQWHRALQRITGVDPVPPEDRGNRDKIAAAWLRWGQGQGYTW